MKHALKMENNMKTCITKGTAKYTQLRDILIHEIKKGTFREGEKFFSERELAQKYNVGRNTAIEALRGIEGLGFLKRVQGKGSFFTDNRQNLLKHKTGNIGIVIGDLFEQKHAAGISVLKAVERRLAERKYGALLICVDGDRWKEQIAEIISMDKADGYVLLSVPGELHSLFESEGVPVVVSGETIVRNIPSVKNDHPGIVGEGISHLIKLGHKKIGMIAGDSSNIGVMMAVKVYELAQKLANISVNENFIVTDAISSESVKKGTEKLINLGVTAILVDGVVIFDYASKVATEKGMNIPGDISIMVTEKPKQLSHIYPDLTGFVTDNENISAEAADMVIDIIEGKEVKSRLIPSKFYEGGTCRKI